MSNVKKKTVEEREEARIGFLTLLAAGIGFAAGLIAFALYHLIGLLTNLFFYGRIDVSFVSPENNQLGLVVILVPTLGGFLAGLMIKYGSPKIEGHGIPEAMESVLLNRSKISPEVGVLKAVSAAVTIGSGEPFGAEGPIIQTGGAFGSFIGQKIRMTCAERRILLSSGAAAGMAATFGTPVSAVLLVVELLLFEFRVKSLVPVGVASAIGAWMHLYLINPGPLFQTPAFAFGGVNALPLYVVLGIVSGVIGSLLTRGLYASEDLFSRLKLDQPWTPLLGGLCVGVIGFGVPQILGVGYNVIDNILNSAYAIELVGMIVVAKAVAWILAMGSKTSGGTLAPLFMVGSGVGSLFGSLISIIFPALGVSSGAYAVTSMAAVFATASRAPFASIVFALEVTNQYQGVIPVLLTVVIAELVGEYLMNESIMTEKLARRGLRVRHLFEYNPLRQVRVSRVMSTPLSSVEADESVVALFKSMNQAGSPFSQRKRLVVVENGRVVGVISRDRIFEAATHADPKLTVGEVCSKEFYSLNEDEFAYQALRLMSLYDVPFIIVLDGEGKPVGYLSRGDLTRALKKKIEDETLIE